MPPMVSSHARLNTDVSTFQNALDTMSNKETSILKSLVQQTFLAEGVLAFSGLILLLQKNGRHEKTWQLCIPNSNNNPQTEGMDVCNSGGKSCVSGALL